MVHDNPIDPVSSDTRQAARKLGKDVGQLKNDIVGIAHDAADVAVAGTADAGQAVRQAVVAAKKTGSDGLDSLKGYVEDHPLTSAGIALGVGVLLGLALGRRS